MSTRYYVDPKHVLSVQLLPLLLYIHLRKYVNLLLQVGQDVVGELTKAMERVGLDMRVTALVSSLFLRKQDSGFLFFSF